MGNIFYLDKGPHNSDVLVLVHGAGCNHGIWSSQVEYLSDSHRVIALDLPGHGLSPGPSRKHISDYTEVVRKLAKLVTGDKRFFIGGHSMGGAIAMNYALTYPEDLKGIILVATGSRLRVNKAILDSYEKGEHFDHLIDYAISKNASNKIRNELLEIMADIPPRVCFDDYRACDNFDVGDRLPDIRKPTLVVCGDEDVLTPSKYSEFLSKNIPGSQFKMIKGSGHFLPVEKPYYLNKTINSFLAAIREQEV
ncbi:MAG TPA: alpha/beta hydrolase [Clostridia bacterium]|nr:alpha/beta hydrolase [Clostridia bacterium]